MVNHLLETSHSLSSSAPRLCLSVANQIYAGMGACVPSSESCDLNWRLKTDHCQLSKREEMGTGARGAPVPEVGLYVKIKRAQSRKPESRPNEERVNSP